MKYEQIASSCFDFVFLFIALYFCEYFVLILYFLRIWSLWLISLRCPPCRLSTTRFLLIALIFFMLYTFSYLRTDSNHPSYIFKNIVKSLILRIRRNCSNISDYFYHCSYLHTNLLKRGYESALIVKLIRIFSKVDRFSLLPYKNKQNFLLLFMFQMF